MSSLRNKRNLRVIIATLLVIGMQAAFTLVAMAAPILVGTPTLNTSSAGRTTATFSHTVPSGTDRLLVVSVMTLGSGSVDSVTYNGVSMVKAIASAATGATGVRVEHWYLVAPTVGTFNVVVTWAASVDPSAVTAANFTGVLQTAPIGAAVSANATSGTSITTSITTLNNDSIIYGAAAAFGGDTDPFTPGGSITETTDSATGTSTTTDIGVWAGWRTAPVTGTYAFNTTSSSSDDWAIAAIEIQSDTNDSFVCSSYDVIETLDYTASMTEAEFDNLLAAGVTFANDLDDPTGAGDGSFSPLRVGLVTFPQWNPTTNATVAAAGLVVALTSSESAVIAGIDQADADASGTGGPGGFGTHIGQAISAAVTEFNAKSTPGNKRVIVLFTDGSDEDTNTEELATTFKTAGGIIYTIGFGTTAADYVYLAGLASGPAYAFNGDSTAIGQIGDGVAAALLCSDFGDLPTSYGDLTQPAAHVISTTLYLGSGTSPDADPAAHISTLADGDDLNGTDDEGGVKPTGAAWVPSSTRQISVTVTGTGGYLVGWFDFNNDGDFADTGESVVFGSVSAGSQNLNVPITAAYTTGQALFARFRLYNGNPGTPSANGTVIGGEVEDHRFLFAATAITLMKLGAASAGMPGPWAGLLVVALGAALLVGRRWPARGRRARFVQTA